MMEFRNQILETLEIVSEASALAAMARGPQEPLDILEGVYRCVRQLEQGRAEVENQYSRAVRRDGNGKAQEMIGEVFREIPRHWRGIGEIMASGRRPPGLQRDHDCAGAAPCSC
jgi:hydrogenase expression/formation protein HypD